jgi:hypothetical protein
MPYVGRWRTLPVLVGVALMALAIAAVAVVWAPNKNEGPITALPKDQMIVAAKDPTTSLSDLTIYDTTPSHSISFTKNAMRPAISPSREDILFTRPENPTSKLAVPYIMDSNGNNLHPFVRKDTDDRKCRYSSRPAWSASGTRVAMVCFDEQKHAYPEIFVFTSGGDIKCEVHTPGVPAQFLTWVGNDRIVYVQMPAHLNPDNIMLSLWQIKDVCSGPLPEPVSAGWARGSYDLPDWSKKHGLLFQFKPINKEGVESGYLEVWNMNPKRKPQEVYVEGKRDDMFRGGSWSWDGEKVAFWWLKSKTVEQLNWAYFDQLGDPNSWRTLTTNYGTGADVPEGKAQPAWGPL